VDPFSKLKKGLQPLVSAVLFFPNSPRSWEDALIEAVEAVREFIDEMTAIGDKVLPHEWSAWKAKAMAYGIALEALVPAFTEAEGEAVRWVSAVPATRKASALAMSLLKFAEEEEVDVDIDKAEEALRKAEEKVEKLKKRWLKTVQTFSFTPP